MRYLKQSTIVTVQVGPFLDATDGVTEETALTPGIEVSKAGAAFAARNSATAVAHDAEGWYRVELDATDTGTLGPLIVKAHDSATHLPVWHEFLVVPAHVYDGLVAGTDNLQVDTVQIGGTAQTARDVGANVDAAVSTRSSHAAADVWSVATRALTDKAGFSLSSAGIQAIWDALTSALTTAGSIGKLIVDNLNATVSSRSSHTAAGVWAEATKEITGGTVDSVAAGGITATTFGAGAIDAAALATDAGQEIADRMLARAIAGGSDSGRTVKQALYRLRNRVGIAGGTMTIYQADDTTSEWSASVMTTAGDPISDIDPA